MSRSKIGLVCALVTVIAVGFVGNALSQDTRPAGGRQRFSPENMLKQRLDRMKETLGANDDEWKVLSPKIEKVQKLQFELMSGRMGRMGQGRGPRGGDNPAPAVDEATQTDLQKKTAALSKLLADKASKADDVKTALADYRAARDKVKEDITKAQKDLKDVVTITQEAQLVETGVLE